MNSWIVALSFVCWACGTQTMASSCPADEPASCPSTVPSYTNDVAPLVQQYCVTGCHFPGGPGGVPLASWGDIDSRVTTVQQQIYDCLMPMVGYPKPTDQQRVTILTWFVCGAPNN